MEMLIWYVRCSIFFILTASFVPSFSLLCLSYHGHLSSRVRAEKVCASTLQSQMSLAKKGRARQMSLVKLRGGFIRQKTRRRGTIIRSVQTPAGASCLSPACHPVHKSNPALLSANSEPLCRAKFSSDFDDGQDPRICQSLALPQFLQGPHPACARLPP